MRSTSVNKKSESVIPARAARALISRCSSSGTFRIWIILDMCRTLSHARDMLCRQDRFSRVSRLRAPELAHRYESWLFASHRRCDGPFPSGMAGTAIQAVAFVRDACERYERNLRTCLTIAVDGGSFSDSSAWGRLSEKEACQQMRQTTTPPSE